MFAKPSVYEIHSSFQIFSNMYSDSDESSVSDDDGHFSSSGVQPIDGLECNPYRLDYKD